MLVVRAFGRACKRRACISCRLHEDVLESVLFTNGSVEKMETFPFPSADVTVFSVRSFTTLKALMALIDFINFTAYKKDKTGRYTIRSSF